MKLGGYMESLNKLRTTLDKIEDASSFSELNQLFEKANDLLMNVYDQKHRQMQWDHKKEK